MTRAQKLRWYSEQLIAEAASAEKAADTTTAVSKYLQAADLLLLLSKVEENYTAWKYYSDNAAKCQHRVRILLASAPKPETYP